MKPSEFAEVHAGELLEGVFYSGTMPIIGTVVGWHHLDTKFVAISMTTQTADAYTDACGRNFEGGKFKLPQSGSYMVTEKVPNDHTIWCWIDISFPFKLLGKQTGNKQPSSKRTIPEWPHDCPTCKGPAVHMFTHVICKNETAVRGSCASVARLRGLA